MVLENVSKQCKLNVAFISCGGYILSSSVYICVVLRVDRNIFLLRCMCAFIVAVYVCRSLLTITAVSLGTPNNWSFSMALISAKLVEKEEH